VRSPTAAWKMALLAAVLVAGCGVDQISKRAVADNLEVGERVEVAEGFLDIRHARNEHAAFGMLDVLRPAIRRPVLIAFQLGGFALAAILVVAWRQSRVADLVPYVLIAAGAAGNVLDRILLGGVVDFIFVHYRDSFSWPVFNVADVLITLGVGLLLLNSLRAKLPKTP